jgi:hypothetical protein
MSVIYLVHPVHGAKVAISEHEAISDEMHGWERYDVSTPAVADVDEDDEEAAEAEPVEVVNELAAPKRRGRRRASQED